MAEHECMHLSARKRPCLVAALTVGLLAVAGCGGSSGGKTSRTSSTASTTKQTPPSRVASASAGSGNTASASADGVTATMHGSTHTPKVERPWPVDFTVTRGGRAATASVSYEYLFDGQVVARRSHYTFKGHFSDDFKWPSSAVGYPLTFRAVIVSDGVTIDLDYQIQVGR